MQDFDYIVIGAGIAGLASAYELSLHGSVAVLEMEPQPGLHTTGRSAAVFIDSYGNEVVQQLTGASRLFMESPPGGFTEVPLLTRIGGLMVAPRDEAETIPAVISMFGALFPEVREVGRDEALAMVPFLSPDYLGGAILDPTVGSIDVSALQNGYVNALRARRATLLTEHPVTAIQRRGAGWHIDTPGETFRTPALINAAGAWADEVATLAGVDPIGIIPKRRTVVIFDPPEGIEVGHWPIVGDLADQFYFKPESGRILASPSDATPMPPCDPAPEDLDVAILMDRIETVSGHEIHSISHKWAGLRTFVQDESPVVGRDPQAEGFFWCAALGGFGIQTAPAIGRIAAAHATGLDTPDDIRVGDADIGPRRAAIAK